MTKIVPDYPAMDDHKRRKRHEPMIEKWFMPDGTVDYKCAYCCESVPIIRELSEQEIRRLEHTEREVIRRNR